MAATLKTVAEELGISRSTVSNAYSRPDQLSAELQARILATAERLGYPGPHPTARSLRSGRVGAIGVLLTAHLSLAFTDPYAVSYLRGLARWTAPTAAPPCSPPPTYPRSASWTRYGYAGSGPATTCR